MAQEQPVEDCDCYISGFSDSRTGDVVSNDWSCPDQTKSLYLI